MLDLARSSHAGIYKSEDILKTADISEPHSEAAINTGSLLHESH